MTEPSLPSSWPLEQWKRLSEHPSPFVRLWVAKTAPLHGEGEARVDLLRTLLEDEKPLVRHHAERGLLETAFPELAEWYLHIALRETSLYGQVSSALMKLALIWDWDRLLTWLDETYAELPKLGPGKEIVLQHLFELPGYLVLMPRSQAEPVAERLHKIVRELRDKEEELFEEHEEIIVHALAGLLLSHPRPREILDFLGQLEVPMEMSESFSAIMGDEDWAERLYKDEDSEEESDPSKDPDRGFLLEHLSRDFLNAWEAYPEQRPQICLDHADRIVQEVLPGDDQAGMPHGISPDDFSRLERVHSLLKLLTDPELALDSRPDDLEECALLLLLLLSAGRTCLGRTEEDFSRREMLSVIAEDRPDMLQDRRFLSRLESAAKDTDTFFREMLLEQCRSALSDYGPAWTKRVLGLTPTYGLEELIPEIMELLQKNRAPFHDEDISYLEETLGAFGSPRIWQEHVHQGDIQPPSSAEEDYWTTLFYIQKAPCSEALDWLLHNLPTLLQQDEMEALEAMGRSGDPRFIPVLQPLLAEAEDERKEVFQTLCRLHGDIRALGPEEEKLLWERREARHREMLETSSSVLQGTWPSFSQQRERVQLRCERCGAVFHYRPERIVIYPSPPDDDRELAMDIGGEIACKSCEAPIAHLHLTTNGHFQIMASAMPHISQSSLQTDLDIIAENRESDKQILVCPQGQTILEESVASMGEGIEKYDQHLALDPQNPSLLVGKANILKRLKRLTEAEACYREALQSDPNCLDALIILYHLCTNQARENEAWEWLQRAYNALPRGTVLHSDPDTSKRELAQIYAIEASKRGMTPDQPIKTRKHRVQRNDPCPCGSGKKYKKCCLEK